MSLLLMEKCSYKEIHFLVEDMIKEVDVDGDGRIDFYGKCLFLSAMLLKPKGYCLAVLEFVNALGEPGTEDSYDDEDDELLGFY